MNTSSPQPAAAVDPQLEPLENVRLQMGYIWFGGAFILGCLLGLRTMQTPATSQELWQWALPTLMPTLGLIASVLASRMIQPAQTREVPTFVRGGLFRFARFLSVAYLLALIVWVFGASQVASTESSRDDQALITAATKGDNDRATPAAERRANPEFLSRLSAANYFLTPFQSLVMFFIGAMFFTQQPQGGDKGSGAKAPREPQKRRPRAEPNAEPAPEETPS